MADPTSLSAIFSASFSPDQQVRHAAEQSLRSVESAEGMLSACLQLIVSDATSEHVRHAVAIYVKNRVGRSWRLSPSASGTSTPSTSTFSADPDKRSLAVAIPATDRQSLKQNLLSVLVAAPGPIKVQMTQTLSVVVHDDFPDQWPGLLESTLAIVRAAQPDQMEGGLLALLEILRNYRYKRDDRTVPDRIAEQTLPTLVSLGSSLLASTPADQAPELVGRLLHLLLKAYRMTMYSELSAHHQSQESIVAWGTLLLQIVNRALPVDQLPADEEERERSEWWKAKKWAYFILNRLYSRYGSPSQLASNMTSYKPFAANFEAHFAPEIFKAYMHQLTPFSQTELYINGQTWLSQRCVRLIIEFLCECVRPKAMWTLLKPHVSTLIERLLFPIFCPTADELEEFTEEPKDWVRNHASDMVPDYFDRPSIAAGKFLDVLVEFRQKATLLPVLSFVNAVVTNYPASRTPREKDGAFCMLESVADSLVKSKTYGKQMEPFFVHHVLPEIASPHAHLRARACILIEQFEGYDMHWEDQSNLEKMLHASLQLLNDPELPVRVCAALALPETTRYPQVHKLLAPNIGRIMQELLALANEVDLDRLTQGMRTLFETFSTELQPFAADLSVTLRDSYLRILTEARDARGGDAAEEAANEEKTLSAMGILKTFEELITSSQELPEMLERLEANVLPMVVYSIEHEFVELLTEILEIIDTLTYFRKTISPGMWHVFELLHSSFDGMAIDFLDEMQPAIDNFILYGSETLVRERRYLDLLLDMYEKTMASANLGAHDRVHAIKIGDAVLLSLRGQCDDIMPRLLAPVVAFITRENTDEEPIITTHLYLHAIQLVVHALTCNPLLTLAYLEHAGATQVFLSKWYARLDDFSRLHDRKLAIFAIAAVIEALPTASPAVAQIAAGLLVGALQIFRKIPEAIAARRKLETEMGETSSSEGGDEKTKLRDDKYEYVGDDEDIRDNDADYDAYLKRLAKTDGQDGDGASIASEESAWSEERLFFSPLDSVDSYSRFVQVFSDLQTQHPGVFAQLTASLNAEQQAQLASIANRASAGGEKMPEDLPPLVAAD